MESQITYNPGVVSGVASDFISAGGHLMELHSDMSNKTNSLVEFFQGQGADTFFEYQAMFLSGLQGLAETVGKHGTVTNTVLDGAMGRDAGLRNIFM